MRFGILFLAFLSVLSLKVSGNVKIYAIDTNADIPGGSRAPQNNQDSSDGGDNDMNRRRKRNYKPPSDDKEI